jgi:hypothetical protein
MVVLFLKVWTSCPMSGPVRQSCLPFRKVRTTAVGSIGVCEMFKGLELEVCFGPQSRLAGKRGEVVV